MNVYIFSLNIVIFSESRNIEIINKNFTNKICFFIGLGTLKPTRTRTLNRIPIWHGLIAQTFTFGTIPNYQLLFATIDIHILDEETEQTLSAFYSFATYHLMTPMINVCVVLKR